MLAFLFTIAAPSVGCTDGGALAAGLRGDPLSGGGRQELRGVHEARQLLHQVRRSAVWGTWLDRILQLTAFVIFVHKNGWLGFG